MTVPKVAIQKDKRRCAQFDSNMCASKVFGKAFRGSLSKGATENRAKRSTNAKVAHTVVRLGGGILLMPKRRSSGTRRTPVSNVD